MKLFSISLTITTLAAIAGSVVAAPGPLHARALEQVDIYRRLLQPLPHQVHHHETASAIVIAMAASHQAAGDSRDAFQLARTRGQAVTWRMRAHEHSVNAIELEQLYRQHRHAEASPQPTALHDQVYEDKAEAERITAEAVSHSRQAVAMGARQPLPPRQLV